MAALPGPNQTPTPLSNLGPYADLVTDESGYPRADADGFELGMFVSYDQCGDAWVRAPDGGISGLVWESGSPAYFKELIPPDPAGRWGTYAVQLELPLTTDAEAEAYLRALLPELAPRWRAWCRQTQRFLP
jgi:hypothetical protein